jgi:hypothetical protein
MIVERTAAYLLAVACVFQMLHPSGTIKSHHWRSIDVQIGWLRVQAGNAADSVCFEELVAEQKACPSATRTPLPHSWQKEPKTLNICINDSGCITAWLDGTTDAWLISRDKKDNSDESLMGIYGSGRSASGDCPIAVCSQ